MTWHRALAAADLAPGQLRRVDITDRALCLACIADGRVFAVDDTCSHEQETLSEGELIGCELECPFHFGRFDVTTGRAVALPATDPLRSYPTAVTDGHIFVDIPEQ